MTQTHPHTLATFYDRRHIDDLCPIEFSLNVRGTIHSPNPEPAPGRSVGADPLNTGEPQHRFSTNVLANGNNSVPVHIDVLILFPQLP